MSLEFKSKSPDGAFEIKVDAWEARNTLWVESPIICDTKSGETLFQFASEMWSLDKIDWLADALAQLALRKYPGNHSPTQLIVVIDCRNRTAEFKSHQALSLQELEKVMERQLTWL